MTKIHVPERFKRVISLHIVKNLLKDVSVRPPLILGIQGGSGEGKTIQCETCLEEMKVKSFLISGGQLESGIAGEPAQLVREKYKAASRSIENGECQAAVVLINDVDTGLGNWGEKVQTTINTQTVYGELMHLVDYPTSVEGIRTKRIPIILTGNDFTKLYEPLVRAGRMTSFIWKPSSEEKTRILLGIFPELTERDCKILLENFSKQPVAFFSQLRSILTDDILWQAIQDRGFSFFMEQLSKGYDPDFSRVKIVSLDNLLQTGQELEESGQLVNHLGLRR